MGNQFFTIIHSHFCFLHCFVPPSLSTTRLISLDSRLQYIFIRFDPINSIHGIIFWFLSSLVRGHYSPKRSHPPLLFSLFPHFECVPTNFRKNFHYFESDGDKKRKASDPPAAKNTVSAPLKDPDTDEINEIKIVSKKRAPRSLPNKRREPTKPQKYSYDTPGVDSPEFLGDQDGKHLWHISSAMLTSQWWHYGKCWRENKMFVVFNGFELKIHGRYEVGHFINGV